MLLTSRTEMPIKKLWTELNEAATADYETIDVTIMRKKPASSGGRPRQRHSYSAPFRGCFSDHIFFWFIFLNLLVPSSSTSHPKS